MSTENTTPNRGYQLPFADNELAVDVLRLISAYSAIDVDVANMLIAIGQRSLVGHTHVIADTTGLQAALDAKQDESEKGVANGYASLGSDGKVPAAQLPTTLFGSLNYQGDWNANTNTPTIPAAAAGNKGWYFMVSVAGASNVGGITDWKVGDWAVSDGTKWVKIDNTDAVSSVAGLVGVITAASLKTALGITIADVASLQSALDGKLGLTATAADSAKLNGMASNAGTVINTIVSRDAAGDITTRLFRSTYPNAADAGITGFFGRISTDGTGDNYARPQSIAQTKALLGVGTMASRSLTVSTAAPSGGVDGDVWFKV